METLGLTSDQRTRLGDIRRNLDDEQIKIGRDIRQARNALDRAIMSPNYNEALVRRYTEELANAHAEQIRFQSRLRVQLRNVLTSDQVIRLRQLEQDLRRQMREEKRDLDKPGAERETVPPAQSRPPNEPEADLVSLLIFNR
jgi:Spy/CpxP family protein refolding chaperone